MTDKSIKDLSAEVLWKSELMEQKAIAASVAERAYKDARYGYLNALEALTNAKQKGIGEIDGKIDC